MKPALVSTPLAEVAAIKPWLNELAYPFTPQLRQRVFESIYNSPDPDLPTAIVGRALESMFRRPRQVSPEQWAAEGFRCAGHVVRRTKMVESLRGTYPSDYCPDPAVDIPSYISRWHSKYRTAVERLSAQIAPMNSECEMTVCIPVAAIDEANYVYDTLKAFTDQTLPRERFEIALLANFPRANGPRSIDAINATLEEVHRFRRDYPGMNAHLCCAEINGSTLKTIAFMRSFISDTPLLRHARRHTDRDHILLRCDSDTRGVNRDYLRNFLECFERDPYTDAFAGQLVHSPERFADNPLLMANSLFETTLESAIRIFARSKHYAGYSALTSHGGPNFAVRASSYAVVEGYSEDLRAAEDVVFSRRLKHWRRDSKVFTAVGYAGSRSRLYTSTRRAEAAIESGTVTFDQWGDATPFQEVDTQIRGGGERGQKRAAARARPPSAAEIEHMINETIRHAREARLPISTNSPHVTHALGLLGLRYEAVDRRTIKVTDMSEFINRLEGFQSNWSERWNRRMAMGSPSPASEEVTATF